MKRMCRVEKENGCQFEELLSSTQIHFPVAEPLQKYYTLPNGKSYCIFHLPLKYCDEDTDKNTFSDEEGKKFSNAVSNLFTNTLFQEMASESSLHDFSHVVFPKSFNLIKLLPALNGVPSATVSFENAEFAGSTLFANTRLQIECKFQSVKFHGEVVFSDVEFMKGITFERSEFYGEVSLSTVKFHGKVDFSACTFYGESQFSDSAQQTTQFNSGVDFSSTFFHELAEFNWVLFEKVANFQFTKFSKRADFSSSQFFNSDFTKAEFKNSVVFQNAIFSQGAKFTDVTCVDANFAGTHFTEEANFQDVNFSKSTSFREARFDGEAQFSSSVFHGETVFEKVRFNQNASFENVEFQNKVDFSLEKQGFSASTKSANSKDITQNPFNKLNFKNASFRGDSCFSQRQFLGETDFDGAEFNSAPNFMDSIFNEHMKFNATFKRTDKEDIPYYQNLQKKMEWLRYYRKESVLYALEQRCWISKWSFTQDPFKWFFTCAYGLFSDFGNSFVRPIVCFLLLQIWAIRIYSQFFCENKLFCKKSLVFELRQIAQPMKAIFDYLTTQSCDFSLRLIFDSFLHVILNLILLALLIVAIRRYFRIKY